MNPTWIHSWAGRITGTHIPGAANIVADRLSRKTHGVVKDEILPSWKEVDASEASAACPPTTGRSEVRSRKVYCVVPSLLRTSDF